MQQTSEPVCLVVRSLRCACEQHVCVRSVLRGAVALWRIWCGNWRRCAAVVSSFAKERCACCVAESGAHVHVRAQMMSKCSSERFASVRVAALRAATAVLVGCVKQLSAVMHACYASTRSKASAVLLRDHHVMTLNLLALTLNPCTSCCRSLADLKQLLFSQIRDDWAVHEHLRGRIHACINACLL